MKNFLKMTLACLTALSIVGIIVFVSFMGIIASSMVSGSGTSFVESNSVLEIKLNSELTDKGSSDPLSSFDYMTLKPKTKLGLRTILNNIENAKTDENIKGIYLNISNPIANFGGYAMLEEIRTKLLEFKKTGKFIYSYSNYAYSQRAYYLASVSDSIYLNPEANMFIVGMGGEMTFYKDFLNKFGIEPQIIRVGTYKSAVEPFMLSEMSKENREQTLAYISAIWNNMCLAISESRGINVKTLNDLADKVEVVSAKTGFENGLIDKLIYEDEMLDIIKSKLDCTDKQLKNKRVSTKKYANSYMIDNSADDKIAVIYATGAIGMKQSSESIGADLAKSIRKARLDDDIKAVVLRVNSPGGSALVSDIIWREVELTRKTKPVIASMGNVAASGGYYISCAADTIVADANTITGSIGIYGMFFTGEKLYKDELLLKTDQFGTNKNSNFGGGHPFGMPLTSRKFNQEEKMILQKFINQGYKTFISRVGKGRNLSLEEVDKIAQGRVWNAMDAKRIGLVDVIGGLEKSIEIAKEKANLKDYALVNLPEEEDSIKALLNEFGLNIKQRIIKEELGDYYGIYNKTKLIQELHGVQARMPYGIELR
ncbi:MAG: signal peptide peptidase SppA [Marinifilaceae bacterium]|jgi:protease-4|nr:signal peptide peptidase SppA [Marinifilaceae bacterium]